MEKYGNQRDGWEVHVLAYKCSAIWKGITSVKDKFMRNIRYHVGSGKKILFWQHTWVGDGPLALKFPDLFRCALERQAEVERYIDRPGRGGQISWSLTFRRNLEDHEETQFISLLDILRDTQIPGEGGDTRIWRSSRSGSFCLLLLFSSNCEGGR